MAEVLVGKHCSVTVCKQLDFLPFTCDGCGKLFCLDHRSRDAHSCDQCLVDRSHADYDGPRSYLCSVLECQGRELMEVICPHCTLNFCLGHRHQVEHQCAKLEKPTETVSKTAEHVKQILENKQPPKPRRVRGGKSSKTAAKVALMKLKQKATGDKGLPETERVYVSVALPLNSPQSPKPVFFSKTWSIGRVIDSIADSCGLRNDNNTTAAKKLRLFSSDTGSVFGVAERVETLIEQEHLFSGSTVILEYVTADTQVLEQAEQYLPSKS